MHGCRDQSFSLSPVSYLKYIRPASLLNDRARFSLISWVGHPRVLRRSYLNSGPLTGFKFFKNPGGRDTSSFASNPEQFPCFVSKSFGSFYHNILLQPLTQQHLIKASRDLKTLGLFLLAKERPLGERKPGLRKKKP